MPVLSRLWNNLKSLVGLSPSEPEPFVADLTRLRGYSMELQRQEPLAAPYVARFTKGGKQLVYVASHHAAGIDNPTSETVAKAIERFKPQRIIVEGIPSKLDEKNITGYVESIKRNAAKQFRHAEESEVTAYLALQQKIPVSGGEPQDKDIFARMEAKGHSTKDIMAFYLLRLIPQLRRDGLLKEDGFAKEAATYLQKETCFAHIPQEARLTIAEFHDWFKAHNTTGKDALNITADDMAPVNTPGASYFNRMNHEIGMLREEHLARTIADTLNHYDRVMVVYGSAHLIKSRPVFEKMFGGKAENIKLVSAANGIAATEKPPASFVERTAASVPFGMAR